MTSRTTARRGARRHALERDLAPHVDVRWAEELVLELRLRGVAGPRIGEALVEVESHCAESGEDPASAFGDPVAYARSLDLPVEEAPARALVAAAWPRAVQVLGMFAVLWGFAAWRSDEPWAVTTGDAASAGLLLASVSLVVRHADVALEAVVRRPVASVVALTALAGVTAVLHVVLDGVVAQVPALAAVGVGAAVMVAALAVDVRRLAVAADEDPVTSPVPGAPGPRGVGARALSVVSIALVPATTLVLLAVTWALGR